MDTKFENNPLLEKQAEQETLTFKNEEEMEKKKETLKKPYDRLFQTLKKQNPQEAAVKLNNIILKLRNNLLESFTLEDLEACFMYNIIIGSSPRFDKTKTIDLPNEFSITNFLNNKTEEILDEMVGNKK
jgi:hypothetical protein